MNYSSWRLIDRSGKNSYTTYVPKGTTDSIIIIIIIIICKQHEIQYTEQRVNKYMHTHMHISIHNVP